MGNHTVDCDFCGQDLRGLSGGHAFGCPNTAEKSIRFFYINHRFVPAIRWATPISIRWGVTEWHTAPQWLMLAFDHEKRATREFALTDCDFNETGEES